MFAELQFSPILAAGGIEVLVALIIIGITSLVNWLKRRNQPDDWTKESSPPPNAPPRKHVDWEAELRRMLDVEEPVQAPPPPPPRPAAREQRPITPPPVYAPVPPPIPQAPPPVIARPIAPVRTYKAHCEHCGGHIEYPSELTGDSIHCPHCYRQTVLTPFQETRVDQIIHRTELANLSEYATAHQRVQQLDELVARRLELASHQPVQQTHAEVHRQRSAEVKQVLALLRSPRTARQAIVASIILNPPKALET